MGVDCWTYLPGGVRVRDVADVIGILLGCKPEWDTTHSYVNVEGVKIESCDNMPECCRLFFDTPHGKYSRLYHFEHYDGFRLMSSPANPLWQAVGEQLVKFFGGRLDKYDCDEIDADIVHISDWPVSPSDGEAWDHFQNRIMAVEALNVEKLSD